ncbi:uncharacterized protein EMH_0091230 [Eimeria mitis]|uniref:Uncharacterized protein n=1 Tax=Eimeria mitis TaxID=44415 RepID=U6KEA9_9EIME|nr:uncharacterized protein EMH_0091230 [Eimeria mitis]CDJ34582.1 hypothetical protein, conserved [Eimeria mitis]
MDIPTSSGSVAFSISDDKRRAAVLNKNGKLSTWRLDVRHQAGEDTKMVAETALQLTEQGNTTLQYYYCLCSLHSKTLVTTAAQSRGKLSTWRLDVRHQAGEDTKMVAETALQLTEQGHTTLHFSRDGSVVIVASGNSIYLFSSEELKMIKAVENLTPQPIERLIVAPNNKFIIICTKGIRPAILRLPLSG